MQNIVISHWMLIQMQANMPSEIMAFPTTILVDRKGNVVGEPMVGGIDNQDNYDALMKQIQSVVDADSANK